jgi:DNA-binding PadR family transcriptional regulator
MYAYANPTPCRPRGRHSRTVNIDFGELMRLMSGRGGGEERGSRGHHGPEHGHRHEHGPRYGRGPGGPFGEGGPGFPFREGPGGPFGRGRGRGRKARRGDVRTAALILLSEEPRNGYQIIQELEQRSDGLWRPSPGSIYPALQLLEDEGLVRSEDNDGRRLLRLTEAGEALVAERAADAPAPWDEFKQDVGNSAVELGGLMKEVAFAFGQVFRVGTERQHAEAKAVLAETRRSLYRILAEGEPDDEAATDADDGKTV